MAETARRYRAFISYSQADQIEARRLHRWLETYRLPKTVAHGDRRRRLGKFFRDEEDLSGASDLGEALKSNIADSQCLIVLCSPKAAQSAWVEREIQHFRQTGRAERVFAVILEGQPNSGDPATECFPPSFRSRQSGLDTEEMPIEPLAVDISADGRERAFIRLAAGLTGARFDDLWRREQRRARRRVALASAMLATGVALTAVAIVGSYVAFTMSLTAARQSSDILARESREIADEGYYQTAMLMALQADPAAESSTLEQIALADGHAFARARLTAAYINSHLTRTLPSDGVWIEVAEFSPDGMYVVTIAEDGVGRIWSSDTGDLVAGLEPPASGATVTAGAFSPDGQVLVTGDEYGALHVRDPVTGEILANLTGATDLIGSIEFDASSAHVVASCLDGAIYAWNLASSENMLRIEVGADPDELILPFALHGGTLAAVLADGTGQIIDLDSGETRALIDGHDEPVRTIAFSPDGERLVSGSDDESLRIWNVRSGQLLHDLFDHRGFITAVAFSPDGERFIASANDGNAYLYETATGRRVHVFGGHDGIVWTAEFSPDGERILTAAQDGTSRLWDARNTSVQKIFKHRESQIHASTFSPDGTLVLTSSEDGAARLWDGRADATIRMLHDDDVKYWRWIASSSDDLYLYGRPQIGEAVTLDAATGERVGTLSEAEWPPAWRNQSVAGTYEAVLTDDLAVEVRDSRSGEIIATLPRSDEPIRATSFSSNGRLFATASADGVARIWETTTGRLVWVLEGHTAEVNDAVFSPDGNVLATTSGDGTWRLWDVATGEPLSVSRYLASDVRSASFSSDGAQLSILTANGVVRTIALPDILLADPMGEVQLACRALANSGADLAFSNAAMQEFPVLQGQPQDADGDLVPPCAAFR